MQGNVLSIIVPSYNEEAVLPESAKQLAELLKDLIKTDKVAQNSKIVFVNDGSSDQTWSIIQKLIKSDSVYAGISLSRNFGHQNAVMAGLSRAVQFSDLMITIDADLQDDIQKIKQMVDFYLKDYDIVFGVRSSRKTDTPFKRWTAEFYYWLMTKVGVHLIPEHADFRMMSKQAVEALLSYHENDLFLRGIVVQLGFKTAKVFYQRKKRMAGKSHYPLKKMFGLALNGLVSFSDFPLKLIAILGTLMFVFGAGQALIDTIFKLGTSFTKIANLLWLLSGINLLALSLIAMYIGKIFSLAKHRPRYIIQEDTYSPVMKKETKA